MKNKFHAISMCTLMAAFATSSWAACPNGFVEGDGEESGDLGVCYYDMPETNGKITTITIPASLKTFKVRFQDGMSAFSHVLNIHCEPQALATTVSVTGAWAQLEKGSLSIRNRINAVALGADASTASMLEKYQSEIDMYNCTDDYCKASSFAENTKKVTGFNALSIVFSSTSDGEQINSFELTVNQEPFDFGPMQIYNVNGLDKNKITQLLKDVQQLESMFGTTLLDASTKALVQSVLAILTANKANVALFDGSSEYGLTTIPTDIGIDSVYFDREFSSVANARSTLALPFSIASDNIAGASEIWQFTRVGEDPKNPGYDAVFMKKVYCAAAGEKCPETNGTLEAYKPYIVVMKDGVTSLKFNGAVTLEGTSMEPGYADFKCQNNSNWVFRGVFEKIAWNDEAPDNVYGYAGSGAYEGQFVRVGAGAYINPFRAYLVNTSVSKLAPANASYALRQNVLPDEMNIVIEGDNNETTVVGSFNTRTGEMKFINNMKHTYDLKGRRVNGTNNARGAYYGKKVLMK